MNQNLMAKKIAEDGTVIWQNKTNDMRSIEGKKPYKRTYNPVMHLTEPPWFNRSLRGEISSKLLSFSFIPSGSAGDYLSVTQ